MLEKTRIIVMRDGGFMTGFIVGLGLFVAANLVAVHVNSTGGLLEGLGIVDRWSDDIRRMGFPVQFFEEGGFSYRHNISPVALLLDIAIGVACAATIGLACSRWHDHSDEDKA